VLFLLLSACDQQVAFEKYERIDPNGWMAFDGVTFVISVTDSIHPHNLYVSVRHTIDYKYSNLYLFIDTHFPAGKVTRDTIEFLLADHTGRWYGKGLGHIKEYRALVSRSVTFPTQGDYTILIEQGMREKKLKGIEDIGIRLERGALQ
jgi:gliding motility-associated lipoprotein GldH